MSEEKNISEDMINYLKEIQKTVNSLDKKIDSQEKRIIALEKMKERGSASEASLVSKFEQEANIPPPPPPAPEASEYVNKIRGEEVGEPIVENAPTKEEVSRPKENMEAQIGGAWFAKIGIVVLLLGVSFFLKYAFDHWIDDAGKFIIGLIIGVILLAIGEKTIRKYEMYGRLLTGGGLVVFYFTIFASLNFYHLFSTTVAFIMMAIVTAIGIALSLRYDALSLMIVAIVGGFLTPVLVSSGVNRYVELFSYVILLDLAVLVVSVFKKWHPLNMIGFVGTIFLFNGWADKFYTSDFLMPTMFFLTVFFLIYSVASVMFNLVKKEDSSGVEQILSLLTAVGYFGTSYFLLKPDYEPFLGLFTIILATYYFLLAYVIKIITPKDENLYNFLAFFTIAFITIAIPIQFKNFVITMLWAVEAVLLLLAGTKNKNALINIFGLVVFSLAAFKNLLIDPELYNQESIFMANKIFFGSVFVIFGCYLSAFFFKQNKEEDRPYYFPIIITTFIIVANLFTACTISREINHYYDRQIVGVREKMSEYAKESQARNYINYYSDEAYQKYKVDMNDYEQKNNLCITIFLLAYSVILVSVGFIVFSNPLLVLGIVMGGALIIKNLFYDLWIDQAIYRLPQVIFAIAAAYLISFVLRSTANNSQVEEKLRSDFIKVMGGFLIAANLLTIILGSHEIGKYYDNKKIELNTEYSKTCGAYSSFSKFNSVSGLSEITQSPECADLSERIKKLDNQSSVALSIFWLLYSLVLLAVGIFKRSKWVRIGGIALLLLSILKLFFYDLWGLGQLYRIISSISLGIVLLGVSFVYQKYKDKITELI